MQNASSNINTNNVPIPKSFKWLMWINIGLALVLPISQSGAQFFCFGGYPLLSVPLGFIFLICSVFSVLALYIMVCVDIFFVFRLWKIVKARVFIPFAVLAIGFFASALLGNFAHDLSENRFYKYSDQYERVVAMIKDGTLPSKETSVFLPSGYRHLTCMGLISVYKKNSNDVNDLAVEFMVGSGGFAGHTAYLYSSSGTIAENSFLYKHWRTRTQVKERWFRVSN
jgi:hypothetical protein